MKSIEKNNKVVESFAKYILINQQTGRTIYELAINNETPNHHERICQKAHQLANKWTIPFENIIWEHLGDT